MKVQKQNNIDIFCPSLEDESRVVILNTIEGHDTSETVNFCWILGWIVPKQLYRSCHLQ